MARKSQIRWPAELLAKAVMKKGAHLSVAAAEAWSVGQFDRHAYIVRVLQASPEIRAQVRTAAIANVAVSNSRGQKELVCILTMFTKLSPADREEFIITYRACATLWGQGVRYEAFERAWQNSHIPPYQPP